MISAAGSNSPSSELLTLIMRRKYDCLRVIPILTADAKPAKDQRNLPVICERILVLD